LPIFPLELLTLDCIVYCVPHNDSALSNIRLRTSFYSWFKIDFSEGMQCLWRWMISWFKLACKILLRHFHRVSL
jgi:hypothetical protein